MAQKRRSASTEQLARRSLKESIFAGALRIISKKGYFASTIPEVAKESGVAAGTIYIHFENKQHLVNEIYIFWKTKLLDLLVAEIQNSGNKFTKESFSNLISKIWEFAVTEPIAFLFLERQNHSEYLTQAGLDLEKKINEFVIAHIQEGQKNGVVRPGNPLIYSSIVYGALVELFKQYYERKNLDSRPEHFESVCAALWAAIAHQ